jgi:hypothetical protein
MEVKGMAKKPAFIQPYKPSLIHKVFSWIDRLPGPYWLFYVGIIAVAGSVNLVVAWNENEVPRGDINWYYAFTALYLGFWLFQIDFLFRIIQRSIVDFLPLLEFSDDGQERFIFRFKHLPATPTAIAFFTGICAGLIIAINIFPTAIEMNNAFPELEIPIFTLTFGMGFLELYMVIRTYILINKSFEVLKRINIYDPNSLYALSKIPVWILVFVILGAYMLFGMNPSLLDFSFLFMVLLTVVWFGLVFSLLWFPIRRVNTMLVLEKQRLNKDVNLRIEATFNLLEERIDNQEFKDISDIREALQGLMIKKEFIKSLRTWPWRPGTFRGLVSLSLAPIIFELLGKLLSEIVDF